MSLPKLNNVPKYKTIIPSTNQEIDFRPFLVREEKILLIGLESQDPVQIATSILDTVVSCLYGEIDSNKLTSYDIEYLFLKIRSKSVGETSNLVLKCSSCEAENEVSVNLEDITMDVKITNNTVEIADDISLEMMHPTFKQISNSDAAIETSPTNQVFALIKESVVAVLTNDERIVVKDIDKKEFQDFIESMTQDQFSKIRAYIESIPKLSHEVKFDCVKCNENNNLTVEGLQSFL